MQILDSMYSIYIMEKSYNSQGNILFCKIIWNTLLKICEKLTFLKLYLYFDM